MHVASSAADSSMLEDSRPTAPPKARAPRLGFAGVPRHWLAGNFATTHVANGINLLFPAGERFFIRSVRHYLDRVSPDLAAQVKGFFGQEGRHAQAHERFFDTMRAQGFEIDSILARYERIAYDYIEKASPPALCLAVTVALEHFTATLAEDALEDRLENFCDPQMRQLLEWHAVEELEHKAVAFDVLREVAPGYPLRMAGLVVASIILGGFWAFAANELLKQEGKTLRDAARELSNLRQMAKKMEGDARVRLMRPIFTGVFVRCMKEYAKPGFHPYDKDHRALIAKTLARLAAEGVVRDEAASSS